MDEPCSWGTGCVCEKRFTVGERIWVHKDPTLGTIRGFLLSEGNGQMCIRLTQGVLRLSDGNWGYPIGSELIVLTYNMKEVSRG